MIKKVIRYVRVSTEAQGNDQSVSIEQQLADIDKLVKNNGWGVVAVFVEKESYVKTRPPYKGKKVNPSGEYDDRPQFLAMLEMVKTGEVDAIVCWRDDRLVRHPRVAVALEDALDEGDSKRRGQSKIEIYDATGAIIDRFTLGIKASLWREENKRRTERMKMGKIGTLKENRWPGDYHRLGYKLVKDEGKRGSRIILADGEEVDLVRQIFNLADTGSSIVQIRQKLIQRGAKQKRNINKKRAWSKAVIWRILTSEDYTGKATWRFNDGASSIIEIPPIIEPDQFERVQKRLEQNKKLSKRNAKSVYLLQSIVCCGECGAAIGTMTGRYNHQKRADGTRVRYTRKKPYRSYRCSYALNYSHEPHPRPYCFDASKIDWVVWRHIVDYAIKQPELILEQVANRQAQLKSQGDKIGSEIAKLRRRLEEIKAERLNYSRQLAKGQITEDEFTILTTEADEARKELEKDMEQYIILRDDAQRVQEGISYAEKLLMTLEKILPEIDQLPDELDKLPEDEQIKIMLERQKIIRALCDQIAIYADGHIVIHGLLDGSEGLQFELIGS